MAQTILIADDDDQMLALLAGILREEGYSVITAGNGEEAVKLAKSKLPDMALLDIKMPKKDGIEVCKEIKNGDKTCDIIVMMLSGSGQLKEINEALAQGAISYITKPSDKRTIVESVKAALPLPPQKAEWMQSKRPKPRGS